MLKLIISLGLTILIIRPEDQKKPSYATEKVCAVYHNRKRNLSSEGCKRSWIVFGTEGNNAEIRPFNHGGNYTRLNETDI